MIISDAKNMLTALMDANISTMLWGQPGIGKTDLVNQVAKDMGNWPVIVFNAILRDPVDIRGMPDINREKRITDWLPSGDLPNEEKHGPVGILFMDEINTAPQAVQAALWNLMIPPYRVAEYQLPPGWRVIAAGNRMHDGAAAQKMPTPLLNRLAHITIDADIKEFINWATNNDVAHEVVSFLKFKPGLLIPKEVNKDEKAFPTPRSWHMVSRAIKSEYCNKNNMHALVSALVGGAAAVEFMAYMKYYASLPTLEEIVKDPKKAKIPTEIPSICAIVSMLAARITKEQIVPVLAYVARMNKEYEVTFMTELINRDKSFSELKEFKAWGKDNISFIKGQ